VFSFTFEKMPNPNFSGKWIQKGQMATLPNISARITSKNQFEII
jgi:hypothetical protein